MVVGIIIMDMEDFRWIISNERFLWLASVEPVMSKVPRVAMPTIIYRT